MNKLILEVYLPAALKSCDVQVPADLQMSQITELTARALSQLVDGLYLSDGQALLCERDSGAILNINMTPAELGLRNGSRLMLI